MFVALAFYFYINGRKKLTILMLALGSAVHIIVVVISFLWLLANIREIKQWYKTFWIYFVVGILPYSMVLILMYLDTPRLLAGHLSLQSINNYLGSTGTVGTLSLFETPKRLFQFLSVIVATFGLALIPMFTGIKRIIKEREQYMLLIAITSIFVLWLYLTDEDPTTWTFINFGLPLIVVLAGLGLHKMESIHSKIVLVGASVLIIVNSVFLNASILTKQYPLEASYESALKTLPSGSYVIGFLGYALDCCYIRASTGDDVRPLLYSGEIPNIYDFNTDWQNNYKDFLLHFYIDERGMKETDSIKQVADIVKQHDDSQPSARGDSYRAWMLKEFGIQGHNTVEEVRYILSEQHSNIYIVKDNITPYWENVFITESYDGVLLQIVGVNNNYVSKYEAVK
jgi:hypothetical protein